MGSPTHGSLFSGIGGIDLGLERASFQTLWQVEIDDYCNRVLEKHWPDVRRYRDVREVGAHNLEPVDLISGGFPCQPVSVAGRQKGKEDARWLWPEMARIVGELKPRWVLVENVPGLRTVNGGEAMAEVLQDLARHGYDAEWASIPAASLGAPHLRYRVFIVAWLQTNPPRPNTNEQRSYRAAVDEQGSIELRDQQVSLARPLGKEVAYAASHGHIAAEGQQETSGVEQREGREKEQESLEQSQGGRSRPVVSKDAAYAQGEQGRRIFIDTISPDFGPGGDWSGQTSWWAVEPDVGRVAHGVPARVDRLRALGNAVVPQVAEWVGKRILEED